ncbi:aldo/keto reductase [Agromyces sp. SYSU T00194]|uniref:aldo/keto reductase n=1 Tax=Agromyces chitinivorans TaxID=3158560 RepID=UPI003394F384
MTEVEANALDAAGGRAGDETAPAERPQPVTEPVETQPVETAVADAVSDAAHAPARTEERPDEERADGPHTIETLHSGPIVMAHRRTIPGTDLEVHPVGLGTTDFGWTLDAAGSGAVLDKFLFSGGNLITTVDSDAAGRAEFLVGSWMRARGCRDQVVLASRIGRHPDHPGLTPEHVTAAVDASLARLGTDRIDLLSFDGDDETVPLEESLGAVDALILAGKVRAIGAVDFSADRLLEARVLAANGLPRFATISTRYNLLDRSGFEGSLELVARAQGLAVLPYTSIASGFLAGTVRRRGDIRRDVRGTRAGAYLTRRGTRVLATVDRIAATHGVRPAAVALAWLLSRPTVAAPVVDATAPEHVDDLMAAGALELTRADILDLDRISA